MKTLYKITDRPTPEEISEELAVPVTFIGGYWGDYYGGLQNDLNVQWYSLPATEEDILSWVKQQLKPLHREVAPPERLILWRLLTLQEKEEIKKSPDKAGLYADWKIGRAYLTNAILDIR